MATGESNASADAILAAWRQGDATRDFTRFLYLADLTSPLTPAAAELAAQRISAKESLEIEGVTVDVAGFVVISQTCDIVRAVRNKPYVEVAPLVQLDATAFKETQGLKRPGFVEVPSLARERLVGDLDRILTLEKSIVAKCRRIQGCRDSREARRFGRAVARKRQRFAFPEDFVAFARPLEALLKRQGKQAGAPMAHIECLEEIRVIATPDWNASKVELQFLFVKSNDPPNGSDWSAFVSSWMEALGSHPRFTIQSAIAGFLRDFDAEAYTESDPLDLDALSPG